MVIDKDGEDLGVHRLGFPEPVGRQGRKLIWSWQQVENWSENGLSTLAAGFFADVPVG